jgi:hypothetical protein
MTDKPANRRNEQPRRYFEKADCPDRDKEARVGVSQSVQDIIFRYKFKRKKQIKFVKSFTNSVFDALVCYFLQNREKYQS